MVFRPARPPRPASCAAYPSLASDASRRACLVAAVAGMATAAATLLPGGAHAAGVEPLTQHDVVLPQPGSVLERRVDDGALAAWIRRVGDAASACLRDHPAQIPTAGFIALAVRPGGRVKAWYDFQPPLAADTEAALDRSIEAVTPVTVTGGPVVVGLRVSVWGARAPQRHAPAPEAWREAARRAGHPLPLDQLIDAVWP